MKKQKIEIIKNLTAREIEVLALVAEGYSNKQVADFLNLSSDTIDTHNRKIVAKLNAKNMKNAIALAIRTHIIT